ncbi:hypothetical protein AB0442_40200 [Kitasatospora sp. NPDC085895]|uniref:hypothetical protein n=1 Tax=Kitasatospora sp. NPDC085895 TaxID=3155057 RepID=UPI00344BD620
MKRLAPATAAVTAVLLAAGCGSVRAGGAGGGAAAPASAATSASASGRSAADVTAQVLAEHDRRYPEVAAGCAGARTATAVPTPSASRAPADPEGSKYAENHAFRQTAPVDAAQQCRGDAHAARILAALTGNGRQPDEAAVRQVLERLGYPRDAVQVRRDGGAAGFSLFVPGAGPCISGRLASPPEVEVHGPYVEGGCTEPKGGH